MKKLFGIRPGGLKRKMAILVLTILIVTVAVLSVFSELRSRILTRIVGETRIEQTAAISQVSGDTMDAMMKSALVDSIELQANIL